jgi:hypothetical protein
LIRGEGGGTLCSARYNKLFQAKAASQLLVAMTNVAQADGVGPQWLPTICKLATEAAALVAPYLGPANFPMDPRQYLKVKRIGLGKMEDSRVVNGVVFQKSMLHRRM